MGVAGMFHVKHCAMSDLVAGEAGAAPLRNGYA